MNSEWTWKRLGDHCSKIGSGSTPRGGKDSYLDSGPFTLIRSQNIYNEGFSSGGLAFIGDEQAKKLDGVAIEDKDILLNITGDSVARVCLAPAKYLPARVNQHVAIIRPKAATFDSRFVRYFLASPIQQDFMLGLASAGATRNALTKVMIEDFKVPCPPLHIQSGIANVLSALDDRIALLRQTNATLEAIAQAMFKSWFVDFDPVHANAKGRAPEGMSEAIPARGTSVCAPGVPPDPSAAAALFPDSFEESALGLVPSGWKVGTLADMAVYQNGYAFKTQDWQDTGHPVVKIGNVKPGIIDIAGTSCVSSDTVMGLERFLLKRGDLLVGMTGYVGETGLMPDINPPAYLNQRVGRISTSRGIADLGFVYCIVRNSAYKTYAEAKSHGSAQANVSGTELMSYPAVLPTSDVLESFNQITHRLIDKILANHAQAQTLATLRDTLLPRLISGQLRLPEVEAVLEEELV